MSIYSFKATITGELYYSFDNYFGVYTFTTEDNIPHIEKAKSDGFEAASFLQAAKKPEGYLAGQVQKLSIGSSYNVRAEVKSHVKYGHQYVPLQVVLEKPTTEEDTMTFLSSVCTTAQARKIIQAHPDFIQRVIDGETKFDVSFSDEKMTEIVDKIQENYLIADVITMLIPLGITYNMIKKITGDVPNPVLLKEILHDNPYILTRIHGIGFKKIDEVALKINPELKGSEKRLRALIAYVFNETANGDGHTLMPLSELRIAISQNAPEASKHLDAVLADEELMFKAGALVGLRAYYDNESFIHNTVKELSAGCKVTPTREYDIKKTEEKLKITFTPEQARAISSTTEADFVIISGSAGTGKSTVIQGVLDMYSDKRIGICALAAKAAQRVREITGFPAVTIHRLLKWKGSRFEHGEFNPLPYDVLIVDEASMINAWLFKKLFEAVDATRTKVILVFDHAQLPPIGSGNVATDLLNNPNLKVNKFTKIHRQAEKSGILMDANLVRKGENPIKISEGELTTGELKDMHYHFVTGADKEQRKLDIQKELINSFHRAVHRYGIESVVIILPRKQGAVNCTRTINEIIHDHLFDPYVPSARIGKRRFAEGSRVIQKVNDYERDVINGEMGYILEVQEQDRKFKIRFSAEKVVEYSYDVAKNIELAYALTVHSYQGSQSDIVIIGIDFSHYVLLDNCLLYTAITRAAKQCKIIAEYNAFSYAIKQNKNRSRKTFLSRIVSGEIIPAEPKNNNTNNAEDEPRDVDEVETPEEVRSTGAVNRNENSEVSSDEVPDRQRNNTRPAVSGEPKPKQSKDLI